MSSNLLNPARMPKVAKAMKAERNVHRITFNPSSANPGEKIYVTLPKLGNNMVFVPYSTFLRFDLEIAKGEKENSFVQNVLEISFRNSKSTLEARRSKTQIVTIFLRAIMIC